MRPRVTMKSKHREKITKIQREFSNLSKGESICLQAGKAHSNQTRSQQYKSGKALLSLNALNSILEIDPVKKEAWVEPRVTMKDLVKATIKKGFFPRVTPEFKGITVGGAIMGAALESSSHQYGQFNDQALEYELLLGNGTIKTVSSNSDSELFYGVSGSFGTLATLLSTRIKLEKAKPFVRVQGTFFSTLEEALVAFETPSFFLEGVIFSEKAFLVLKGVLEDRPTAPLLTLHRPQDPWFFGFLKDQEKNREFACSLPLQDYLFRFDRGAFWMGAYALTFPLLFRYALNRLGISLKQQKSFQFKGVNTPGLGFRILTHLFSGSQTLYKLLHYGSEGWFSKRFVIQDFYLPTLKAPAFLETLFQKAKIFPLWLCPIKGTSTPQIFSPHFQDNANLVNIGVYGYPAVPAYGDTLVKALEEACFKLGGRKMLYAQNFYQKDQFWEIYSRPPYEALRNSFFGTQAFPSITEKILLI